MSRRVLIGAVCAVVLMDAAIADGVPLPVLVGGRVVQEDGGPRATYQWPGVYFEAAFTGDRIDAKVDDGQDNLYLYVDGVHKLTLTRPGKTTVSLADLGAGAHVVRLEKASETQAATGSFEGFFVPSQSNVLPAPKYTRRIEFIGDSYTVGYGNTSRGQICSVDDVRDTTDVSQSWAPIAAKHFNADYRIHAFSGRGIVRNYDGHAPGETLPFLYRYTLFDRASVTVDDGWTPDVIVVGLGTNDFATALKAGEHWDSRESLRADAVRTYADFIKALRAKNPTAHILLMASDGANGEIAANMKAAAELAASEGVSDLEYFTFTGLDWMGCHYHPSLKDDILLSQLVIDRLTQLPKFTRVQ